MPFDEVRDQLVAAQGGLCGYCEQRLTKPDGRLVFGDHQIEHVLPKAGAAGRTLDWQNLMLCCGGGVWAHHADRTRYLEGAGKGRGTRSCGQAKAEVELPAGCDPRDLPWREPMISIGLDGTLRAEETACRRHGLDPGRLQHAIDDVLRLNCDRLRLARSKVVEEILQWFQPLLEEVFRLTPHLSDANRRRIGIDVAGGRLGPDEHGHLRPFWSTERQYLGPSAEDWIRGNAATLGFA